MGLLEAAQGGRASCKGVVRVEFNETPIMVGRNRKPIAASTSMVQYCIDVMTSMAFLVKPVEDHSHVCIDVRPQ